MDHRDQLEVNSGRVVSPGREDDGASDSKRTTSFQHIPGDEHGDIMEAESGRRKIGDQDARSNAQFLQTHEKGTPLETEQGKIAFSGHQEIIRLQRKKGLLKILPKNNKKVVRGTYDGNTVSESTKMDGEVGAEKHLLTKVKVEKIGGGTIPTKRGYLKLLLKDNKMEPLHQVQHRKEKLPLPQWLKDYKSEVADLDGWQAVQVSRTGRSGRKDKYYTHRDYAHTFRSKREVAHFLETGEVKGKHLLRKISADPSSGQNYGPGVQPKEK